jgi:hypothetical protein
MPAIKLDRSLISGLPPQRFIVFGAAIRQRAQNIAHKKSYRNMILDRDMFCCGALQRLVDGRGFQ